MNGWLVHFDRFTVWVQSGKTHADAIKRAEVAVFESGAFITANSSQRVRDGKAGPRRPA